jgi:hypothetical protein
MHWRSNRLHARQATLDPVLRERADKGQGGLNRPLALIASRASIDPHLFFGNLGSDSFGDASLIAWPPKGLTPRSP